MMPLIPQQQPQQTAPAAPGPQAKLNASSPDKLKQDFAQYVSKATTMINSPQTRAQTLTMLKGSDPCKQVSQAAVIVMQQVDALSRRANIEVRDDIKFVATYVIIEQLAQMASAAGLYKLDKDYCLLAMSMAVQNYIKAEVAAHRVDAKQVAVQMQIAQREMPPEQKKAMADATRRMPEIAKRYQKDLRAGKFRGGA